MALGLLFISLFFPLCCCTIQTTFSCKWCKVLKQALNNNSVDPTKRLFGTRLRGGSFAFVFEKCCHASNINYAVGNVFSQHHNTRARSLAYCISISTCLQRTPALINVGQRKDRMFDGRGPNPVDIQWPVSTILLG